MIGALHGGTGFSIHRNKGIIGTYLSKLMRAGFVCVLVVVGVWGEYCANRYGAVDESGNTEAGSSDVTGWIIGIFLCIGSAFASVVGVTFQKKAHMQNETAEVKKSYVKLPKWWIGISGVIAGAILDFVSLGFAPQTVVASLGSMTLVINALVAPIALGEKVSRLELGGTITITAGAAIAVGSSSQRAQEYNLDILKCLYREDGFVAYAVLITLWSLGLLVLFRIADAKEANGDVTYYPTWAKLHPFSITALSGTLGAQSLLFAKSVSIILRGVYQPSDTSDGASAFKEFETYLIIFAMVFTIVTQTHTLNMALQRFDSVVVLPLFQVFWIIMGVFGAGAYFKEFDGISTTSMVLFPFGILIIALGIGILSSRTGATELESSIGDIVIPNPTTPTAQPVLTLGTPAVPAHRRVSSLVPSFSGALYTATLRIEDTPEYQDVVQKRKMSRKVLEQHRLSLVPGPRLQGSPNRRRRGTNTEAILEDHGM